MLVKKESHFSSAIVLTPEKLKRMVSLFELYYSDLHYNAALLDGSTVKFADYNELVSYNNCKRSRIKDIWIFGKLGYDSSAFACYIKATYGLFVSYGHSVEVVYSLESLEDATVFRAKLAECIDVMKRPTMYTVLCKLSATFLVMMCGVVCLAYTAFYFALGGTLNNEPTALMYVLCFACTMLIYIFLKQIDRLWATLYPPVTFLWGEEIERERKNTALRSNIFWGVVVATVVGVTVAFIMR